MNWDVSNVRRHWALVGTTHKLGNSPTSRNLGNILQWMQGRVDQCRDEILELDQHLVFNFQRSSWCAWTISTYFNTVQPVHVCCFLMLSCAFPCFPSVALLNLMIWDGKNLPALLQKQHAKIQTWHPCDPPSHWSSEPAVHQIHSFDSRSLGSSVWCRHRARRPSEAIWSLCFDVSDAIGFCYILLLYSVINVADLLWLAKLIWTQDLEVQFAELVQFKVKTWHASTSTIGNGQGRHWILRRAHSNKQHQTTIYVSISCVFCNCMPCTLKLKSPAAGLEAESLASCPNITGPESRWSDKFGTSLDRLTYADICRHLPTSSRIQTRNPAQATPQNHVPGVNLTMLILPRVFWS